MMERILDKIPYRMGRKTKFTIFFIIKKRDNFQNEIFLSWSPRLERKNKRILCVPHILYESIFHFQAGLYVRENCKPLFVSLQINCRIFYFVRYNFHQVQSNLPNYFYIQRYMKSQELEDRELFDLILRMLDYEPSSRCTLAEAMTHSYFK